MTTEARSPHHEEDEGREPDAQENRTRRAYRVEESFRDGGAELEAPHGDENKSRRWDRSGYPA